MLSSYCREIFIAAKFGADFRADAYLSLFTIIRFVADIGPCAILLACIIPVVTSLLHRPLAVRSHLLSIVSLMTLASTVMLALGVFLVMPWLLTVAAPGFSDPARQTAITLAGSLVWLLPLQTMGFLFSLALNAHGRFLMAAAAPVLSNGLFILVLALSGEQPGVSSLSLATLVGPGLTMLVLGLKLAQMNLFRLAPSAEAAQALRSLWTISRPMMLALGLGSSTGLLMICHLMLRREGSLAGEGTVAALAYAFRIYEVPVTLTANIAATLVLPSLSALHGVATSDRLGEICRGMVEWGVLLLVPMVAVTAFAAPTLVEAILVHGRFSLDDAARTAAALRGFSPAILFEAAIVVFYPVLYAIRCPKTTLVTSLGVVSVLALLLTLIPPQRVDALALGFSTSFAVGALILGRQLYRRFGAVIVPFRQAGARIAGVFGISGAVWLPLSETPLLATVAFCSVYLIACPILLPNHRAMLTRALRQGERA